MVRTGADCRAAGAAHWRHAEMHVHRRWPRRRRIAGHDAFAKWTTPKSALIAGANTDGLISTPIYEAHGATVLNTAHCGAIKATIDPTGLKVDTFLPRH